MILRAGRWSRTSAGRALVAWCPGAPSRAGCTRARTAGLRARGRGLRWCALVALKSGRPEAAGAVQRCWWTRGFGATRTAIRRPSFRRCLFARSAGCRPIQTLSLAVGALEALRRLGLAGLFRLRGAHGARLLSFVGVVIRHSHPVYWPGQPLSKFHHSVTSTALTPLLWRVGWRSRGQC